MTETLRKTGLAAIGDVPWGTHFCQFYQTKRDLLDILVPYFQSGLENNEYCMWITAEPLDGREIREAMQAVLPDFDRCLEKGQMEILPHTEWYLQGGRFDSQRVLDGWVTRLDRARAAGYAGLRLTGNTFWLEKKDWKAFTDYEEEVNRVIGRYPMLAACTYCLDRCGAHEIIDVVNNHQFALIKKEGRWELIESSEHRRLREVLHETGERYRTIFEQSPLGIELYDSGGRLIEANPACRDIFGIPSAAVIKGLSLFDDRNLPDEAKGSLRKGNPIRAESTFDFEKVKGARLYPMPKSGVRTLDTMVTPLRKGGSAPAGYLLQVQDVTDRRRAEEDLREGHRRLELLAETASRLLASDAPQTIVDALCRNVLTHLDCHVFFNYLVDGASRRLRLNAYGGIPEDAARAIEWLDYGVAVCGCVARDGCRIVAEDIPGTPDPRTDLERSFGVLAYACFPLVSRGLVIGTLSFGTRSRLRFSEEDLALMKTVADQVAMAMERMRFVADLQASEGALRRIRDELEARVQERTAELEKANSRLQAEIAERRQAQDALRTASLYARSLIEASLDPLVTISAGGKVMDVNKATELATGISRDRLIGTDFSDYFTDPQKARAGYRQVFLEGSVRDYPLAIRHASGRVTEVLYNATTYTDEAGRVQGVFAAARDVTERNRAEEALRRAHDELEIRVRERTAQLEALNRELEGFSYSVAHDLRAPLRAIDGFAQMLVEDYDRTLGTEGKRLLDVIRGNTRKMATLIDDLLAFSRLGRQEIRLSDLDMAEIAQSVFAELKADLPDRRLEFRLEALPRSRGDTSMVRLALGNLLANAIKFTRPRELALIEVGGAAEANESRYFVRDNGVGFNMKYIDKVFGVFQRLHSAEEFEGTGVGLAIVERIVHRHGGRVWAEAAEGKGATFYFTLPSAGSSRLPEANGSNSREG
jgi:PAS domain S-box-containing protein